MGVKKGLVTQRTKKFLIIQRIHWIRYTLVFFCYMPRWKELRHCSLVEDGRKYILQCHYEQYFCACLLSFNTYKEKYCHLWRLCMKGWTCLCNCRQGLRTAYVIKFFHSIQTVILVRYALKVYWCSHYFYDGFSNRWSCPEIAISKCEGYHHLIQYCEL